MLIYASCVVNVSGIEFGIVLWIANLLYVLIFPDPKGLLALIGGFVEEEDVMRAAAREVFEG